MQLKKAIKNATARGDELEMCLLCMNGARTGSKIGTAPGGRAEFRSFKRRKAAPIRYVLKEAAAHTRPGKPERLPVRMPAVLCGLAGV